MTEPETDTEQAPSSAYSYTYNGHGPAVFPDVPNDHGGGLEVVPGDTVRSDVLLHHGHLEPADAATRDAHKDEAPLPDPADTPVPTVPVDIAARRLAGRNN